LIKNKGGQEMTAKKTILILALVLTLFSCAPNNEMYLSEPAGFWAGLWHGLICIITFIISLFTDSVRIYEVNNSGTWYDFGFILGALISLGQGGLWSPTKKKRHPKSEREKEWEEIGTKIEEKVRTGIRKWLDERDKSEEDWEEIGKKVEEKIKRELRNWAER
jgi:hypothetical protein